MYSKKKKIYISFLFVVLDDSVMNVNGLLQTSDLLKSFSECTHSPIFLFKLIPASSPNYCVIQWYQFEKSSHYYTNSKQ